jgi:hypothetical protein
LHQKRPKHIIQEFFDMAAVAISENSIKPSMFSFLNSACCSKSVYRISSKSDHKQPRYSLQSFFNIATAAILEYGVGPKWLSFFELSMLFLVCVLILIEIGSKMAEVQSLRSFQQGGGGHLGIWRRPVGDECFGLS